jgi:hypothetical protein
MGPQDLIDNLEVVVTHLRGADTAPEIHTQVLATLWQANVVVEQDGSRWINSDLESAYGKFSAVEHPAELPSDGHRDQWRKARDHIVQEAEQFAAAARQDHAANAHPGALEPLARATEVMAYQLGEGIPIN